MDELDGKKEASKNELPDKALHEYDQALEIGRHSDNIIHEVAAIVWGADTLLLGFILEVPCESKNQSLVIVAAIVGVFMSLYVLRIHRLAKINQNTAYEIAQKIERELSFPYKLNNKIRENYPPGKPGFRAVKALTFVFIAAWGLVILHACVCLFCVRFGMMKRDRAKNEEHLPQSEPIYEPLETVWRLKREYRAERAARRPGG
jgi:hypothetical protein